MNRRKKIFFLAITFLAFSVAIPITAKQLTKENSQPVYIDQLDEEAEKGTKVEFDSLSAQMQQDIAKALSHCDLFGEKGLIYYCATGAFMERSMMFGSQDLAAGLLYPCDSFAHPAGCFRYKIREYLRKDHSDTQVSQICLDLKDDRMRQGCFHGIGFGYFEVIEQNPNSLLSLCGFGDDHDKRMCIEGAVGRLALSNLGQAEKSCRSLTESKLKKVCQKALQFQNFGMERDFDLYFHRI